jgi:enoyl-CoA hydratase
MTFRVSDARDVAVIEMAHGKANAFDVEFFDGLHDALEAARSAKAVVLTAKGGIFSAGVDLPKILSGDRRYLDRFLRHLSDGLAELFTYPKPLVAAINGHAIAGGAIIACGADYRVIARGGAKIGVPELRVGVPFPLVASEIVRYALGSHRGQRAILMGLLVSPDQSILEGYADEIVDPERLMDRALAVATELSALVPESYARTKADLRRPTVERWERLRPTHDPATLDAWDSAAVRDAIQAHVERTLNK